MEKIQCDYCQSTLLRHKSVIKKNKHNYCNPTCALEHRRMLDLQAKRTISKECPICKTSFTSSQSRETVFCSKKCHFLNTRNRNLTTCKLCGKDVIRTKCRTTKHKNIFCSCSCRAKYYIDQRTGYRRSKSEIFICNLIKNDFPHIVPLENRKDLLPCGYEIDIFISECQLAIELNGPCHYFKVSSP